MPYFYSIFVPLGLLEIQRLFTLAWLVRSSGSRHIPAPRCEQAADLSEEIGR